MTTAREASWLRLRRDAGPDLAYASKEGIGFHTAECWRYDVLPESEGMSVAVCGSGHETSVTLTGEEVLEYFVFPARGDSADLSRASDPWFAGGYASTGVAVDIVFADGTRLSRSGVDHHGVAVTPASQGESMTLSVGQWNRKEVSLASFAGAVVDRIEVGVIAAGGAEGFHGWIDGPRIAVPKAQPKTRPSDWVETTRGTHSSGRFSRGNTLPAAALPNGGSFVIPVSRASDPLWPYSYHADNDSDGASGLDAFAVSHSPTPWLGDRGVVHFFPIASGGDTGRLGRRKSFRHDNERARAHSYRVEFDDGTRVRLVPTRFGALAEFVFPEGSGEVVLDQVTDDGTLHISGATLLGHTDFRSDMAAGSPRMHFAVEFDVAPSDIRCITIDDRSAVGAIASFGVHRVVMRIETSFVSGSVAQGRLAAEPDAFAIDDVEDRTQSAWDDLLGTVQVAGATPDQLTTLYSSLYRLFLYPNVAHEDVDGGSVHAEVSGWTPPGTIADGALTVNNGFWDTYRTAWPAYFLLAPARAAKLLDGFVSHYADSGWMPRWSAPGPTDCMVGTSSDVVFADAAIKAVPMGRLWEAFQSAIKNATVPSDRPEVGRKGLNAGIFKGYTSNETPEGLSWTLEGAINDFGIAKLCEHLLKSSELTNAQRQSVRAYSAYFSHRARSYELLWDSTTNFFRGRDEAGEWTTSDDKFDPAQWGGDYTETNAWGMRFTVPHDGEAFARLVGGPEALADLLDEYFETPEPGDESIVGHYGRVIHEMTEARDVRMGMFAISNQPAHHIPYMYAHSSRPHSTQAVTRSALRRLFLGSEIGQGYPGDEDNGEFSAWYLFSSLGLYPLALGSGEYVITAPLFDEAEVRPLGGESIRVRTVGNAPGADYISSVTVNGVAWRSPTIDHATVTAGADIVIQLGAEPRDWSSPPPVALRHMTRLRDVTADASAPRTPAARVLSDDVGATPVDLPIDLVEWRFEEPVLISLVTLSNGELAESGSLAWVLEAEGVGGAWQRIAGQSEFRFTWPLQTQPFLPEAVIPTRALRLRTEGEGSLRQVELFEAIDVSRS